MPAGEFSPHAWGWTVTIRSVYTDSTVLPTRVGVDRAHRPATHGHREFSPHAWGWTAAALVAATDEQVLPTRVGVDRIAAISISARRCSPHTRGGGPPDAWYEVLRPMFSPHAWGWTDVTQTRIAELAVLPTRVGVDRIAGMCSARRSAFSPHAWGWTAEVGASPDGAAFSPHAWGWTTNKLVGAVALTVLPTRVGVDRDSSDNWRCSRGSPHTRGGGPRIHLGSTGQGVVLPTRVGVDRYALRMGRRRCVLPTRVGVDR